MLRKLFSVILCFEKSENIKTEQLYILRFLFFALRTQNEKTAAMQLFKTVTHWQGPDNFFLY